MRKPSKLMSVTVFALASMIAAHPVQRSYALGIVTVTGWSADHSSVKIYFNPVPGAKDYRVYDVTDPTDVKYAGLTNESSLTPVPATQIDWNAVGDGQSHSLIVEAVDALGPVPQGGLYSSDTNIALVSPTPAGAMIGSNKGPTPDGKTSTNGQGPYWNNPQVIARSQAFVVQVDRNYKAIPSMPGATSTFFDTFENSEAATVTLVSTSPATGTSSYKLNGGTQLSATVRFQLADVVDSMAFISADHFMDMLFDGGTPGTNNPLHQGHGVMGYSPDATASWSNGQVLHITEEVDGHTDLRRWMDLVIVPANDPATALDAEAVAFNQTNQAVRLQIFNNADCTLDIYTGPAGGTQIPTGTAGGAYGSRLWGGLGQAPLDCSNIPYNGLGLDNKSRFDLFLSQNHVAYFIDGQLVRQSDISAGTFPWAYQPVKIYYSHYVYHTDLDITDLLNGKCGPMNSFWFNDPVRGTAASQSPCNTAYPAGYGFPRSDERHWDNMGFEVLPASAAPANDFAPLASLVRPPTVHAIQLTPSAPTNFRIVAMHD